MPKHPPTPLVIRLPLSGDEVQARAAHAELAEDDFEFLLMHAEETWDQYLERIERERLGIDLPEGRVPATMLFALAGDEIVGRVHIRHDLTGGLLAVGGHVGYGVRPAHRGRGYAIRMLEHALSLLRVLGVRRALVTCDDGNLASARTIERCGGVLENILALDGVPPKRRYWIELGQAQPRVDTPRPGDRPAVSNEGPQTQLSQQSPPELWGHCIARVFALPGVVEGHSAVSPASSRAVFIDGMPQAPRPEASLAPDARFEPVHIHGVHDTSAHLVLAPERGAELTRLGWVEPHQYADFGTEFLLYGPRDEAELDMVLAIIEESIAWARGDR